MALLSILAFCYALLACANAVSCQKPPAFFLAGDSTTAPQNPGGGGWGNGFLNWTLTGGAYGINFGVDGRTTESFVSGGYWAQVIAAVNQYKDRYDPYITIQFGHNDQKPSANISIPQFIANLEQLAAEAVEAGATPIILTPLTRRNFNASTSPEEVEEDLLNVTVGAKIAAENGHYHLINLNEASMAYCNSIGPVAANTYDLTPTDHTHLGIQGSIVFGGIVAELLLWEFPQLSRYISIDPDLSLAIKEGIYWWPVVVNGNLTTGANSSAPLDLSA